MRGLSQSGYKARIAGMDSKESWGPPRLESPVVISTAGLVDGFKHDRDDLVVTVPAGMLWRQVQDLLAVHRQWIALDPPLAQEASVGGVVATASTGPRRLAYAAVRDQVIGAHAVLADGRLIKAGGRVIKNVAGYDLCKLLVGSFGTLGVITEVTFKVAPLPESRGWLEVPCPDLETAHHLARKIMSSQLQPSALQLLFRPDPVLRIDLDGLEAVVSRQLKDIEAIIAGSTAIARAAETAGPLPVHHPSDMLAAVEAPPAYPSPAEPVIRCGVPSGHWLTAIQWAHQELAPMGAVPHRVDLGSGLLWWKAPATGDDARQSLSVLAGAVCRLDQKLIRLGGYATVQSGPWPLRRWVTELQHQRFALSERVRRIFDPNGLFNPLPLQT